MSVTSSPQLATYLVNFEAEDPGGWSHLIDFALAADAAGFDLVSVSDHVAFGERLHIYADPLKEELVAACSRQGPTAGGSIRSLR